MPARYETSLFIFRRDLRLDDNTGLNAALALSRRVLPCFIFDPRQIEAHPYQSRPGLHFMLQALAELEQRCSATGGKLAFFLDDPCSVIRQLALSQRIQAVFFNRDYSPFSRRRDQAIAALCRELGLDIHVLPDALLNEPEAIVKNDGSPYQVFTAYYKKARQMPVALPKPMAAGRFLTLDHGLDLKSIGEHIAKQHNGQDCPTPAFVDKSIALRRLAALSDYAAQRDYPALGRTSQLSAALKSGVHSIRAAYYAILESLGNEHPLLRQLYWRDFFTHIAYHFPEVFGQAFLKKFAAVEWDDRPDRFEAWRAGKTGFPIVDAGMRELNATGFMHNRLRMLTASFLVKDLHIDWRLGERYFAQHLADYDPCVNNGNWQWAASTGCDAQPYFRIFNPWTQQQKFDPDCAYIYRWLPELRAFPPATLHQWDKRHATGDYPAPIVDHAQESRIAKRRYLEAAQAG